MQSTYSKPLIVASIMVPLFFLISAILLVENAPSVSVVKQLSFDADQETIVLGQEALQNRLASKNHVQLTKQENEWFISNIAPNKKLYHYYLDEGETKLGRYLHRWELKEGDDIWLGAANDETASSEGITYLRVLKVDVNELHLENTITGDAVFFKNGQLQITQPLSKKLPWWRAFKRDLKWYLRDWSKQDKELFLFYIGGKQTTETSWSANNLVEKSLKVVWKHGKYWLAPTPKLKLQPQMARENLAKQCAQDATNCLRFRTLKRPLFGQGTQAQVIIGKTRYRVTKTDDNLLFAPISNQDMWHLKDDGVSLDSFPSMNNMDIATQTWCWIGMQTNRTQQYLSLLSLWGVLAIFIVIGSAFYIARKHKEKVYYQEPTYPLAYKLVAVGMSLFFIISFPAWRTQPLEVFMLIAWLGWSLLVWMPLTFKTLSQNTLLIILSAYILAGFGSLVLIQLAAGSESTSWLVYAEKRVQFLAMAAWPLLISLLLSPVLFLELWKRFYSYIDQSFFVKAVVHLTRFFIFVLAVILSGLTGLVLYQFLADSGSMSWLVEFKQDIPYLLIGWFVLFSLFVSPIFLRKFWEELYSDTRQLQFINIVILIVTIVLMFVQVAFGSEGGVFGFQPVELVKLLLVLMMAIVGFTIANYSQYYFTGVKRYSGKAGLILIVFGGFLMVYVLSVNDFSPFVIMSFLIIAWVWHIVAIAPFRSITKTIVHVIIFIGIVLIILLFIGFNNFPEYIPPNIPNYTRFMAWARPDLYPESGYQVIKSLEVISAGGFWGRDVAWSSGNYYAAMQLPVVQNDFIGAFIINQFGELFAVLLIMAQAFYLYLLLSLSSGLMQAYKNAEEYTSRDLFAILSFIIFGLATIHFAQWFIAWGNALGFLPVMGQPMTWVAAGKSHLSLFTLPTLLLAIIASSILYSSNREKQV